MDHNVEFLVVRVSTSELTFAKVMATVTDENLTHEANFLGALRKALTQWACDTEEGRMAWKQSSYDFNVGDLAGEVGAESMQPCLEKVGIKRINIGIETSDNRCVAWNYDTVLVDRAILMPWRKP